MVKFFSLFVFCDYSRNSQSRTVDPYRRRNNYGRVEAFQAEFAFYEDPNSIVEQVHKNSCLKLIHFKLNKIELYLTKVVQLSAALLQAP